MRRQDRDPEPRRIISLTALVADADVDAQCVSPANEIALAARRPRCHVPRAAGEGFGLADLHRGDRRPDRGQRLLFRLDGWRAVREGFAAGIRLRLQCGGEADLALAGLELAVRVVMGFGADDDGDGDLLSEDEGGREVQDGFERRQWGAADGEEGGQVLQDRGLEHGPLEPA